MLRYFQRTIYLGYYFKQLDKAQFKKFFYHIHKEKKKPKLALITDIIRSVYKFNVSLIEYFNFKFYELGSSDKITFAGAGFMYEYQLVMNPKKNREILENKLVFLQKYAPFIKHKYLGINEMENEEKLNILLNNKSGKIVLKNSYGQCGEGVKVLKVNEIKKGEIKKKLIATNNDLIEEFIIQHDALNKLSPSGLNTLRLITQINKNESVEVIAARLRITINSSVDNLAAGNIAAPIDLETGSVNGPGVYSDITKSDEEIHPITGHQILGFEIPFWRESLQMVKEAALLNPQNKSIGWDVAITNDGPELLEGNHNWCRLLWQLPVKRGLKKELEKYL